MPVSRDQIDMLIGVLTELRAETDEETPHVPPRPERAQPSDVSRLLDIEGGYVPGRYLLADWLVAQSRNEAKR